MVSKGYQKPLEMGDMFQLRHEEQADVLSNQFHDRWNQVRKEASSKGKVYVLFFLTRALLILQICCYIVF